MSDNAKRAANPLKLLDDSGFPIVRYRVPEPASDAFRCGDDLLADLEALLARDVTFVLISTGQHDREPFPIRQGRAAWFRQNGRRLAQRCKGMIHVEPDPDERRRITAQLSTISGSIGVAFAVVETIAAAETVARSMARGEQEAWPVPETNPDMEKGVAALLATFQSKLLARDFDALEALMTEDFTYVGADGAVLDRQSLLEREKRGAGSEPMTEIEHRLVRVHGDQNQAEALVEMRFRTVIGTGSSQVCYAGQGRERVTLRRGASSWQFLKVVVEDHQLTRNGEPVGGHAIEEMHRGPEA